MGAIPFSAASIAMLGLATSGVAQSLPDTVLGSWDVSAEECRTAGTSVTQIDITPGTIVTFGGDAIIVDIDRSGPVTFVAAAYLQTEGAIEVGAREPAYFRLTQSEGRDRLSLVWKDVQAVDLVRCGADARAGIPRGRDADGSRDRRDSLLPIPTGVRVIAGDDCQSPANASWHIFDGRGLYGAQSRRCTIDTVFPEGPRLTVDQTCTAARDGHRSTRRDHLTMEAPRRFSLVAEGEAAGQDFNCCGPDLRR
ncbi:hypothetical protein [Paracoccus spongiarum]|uniref:Peptidase n=1 Tax=Paracoccus spongiarum TaxID=3064387 RepID=A0ABT9JFF2_9RHOB|nr:hypothetical protein [Paracoccus sp. 2205BS29-5]MDP5308553.1 hypothetical protein [Paracoccus sp. 2205BS29-5]